MKEQTTDWRAGCGRSASPVRRGERGESPVPTSIFANSVQIHVHRTQTDHSGNDIRSPQRFRLQMLSLRLVQLVVLGNEVVGGEQEAAGAAGGIADHLPGLGGHDIDDGADEWAGGEVLAGSLVRRAGGLFEQAFVDGALDVHVHAGPILIADHLDHALEVGRVGDLVLGLAEDDANEAGHFAEVFEGVAVVDFEVIAALAAQLGPGKLFRDRIVEAQLGHLIGELEEEQVGDLLDVVAVTDPRVLKDVGVVDRKSTRLNSSHRNTSRMPSSA